MRAAYSKPKPRSSAALGFVPLEKALSDVRFKRSRSRTVATEFGSFRNSVPVFDPFPEELTPRLFVLPLA
jgi:hypothetical protein